MDGHTTSSPTAGSWRRITSRASQARTVGHHGKSNAFPEPDSQMHMVYCCQNHSGSPALTAPVPKKALTPCATVYGFDAPLQTVLQTPLPPSHDLAHVEASLHALKQFEHVQEEAAGSFCDEDCLSLAASRLPEPKLAEADQLSSHVSMFVNHGSLSSFAAEAPLHHQYHDNDNGEIDAPPVLHSMPAKRKSILAWPLLKGAQDDLHHSLFSAAHAAEHQSLLLSNDGYADSVAGDLDSAQRHKLLYGVSNMLAAIWQFLCGVAGALRHWSKCCPSAAESLNNI